MIVVDASAITELLLQTELGTVVERRIYRDDDDLHAPPLLDVEVLSALRRLVRAGELIAERAEEAIEDLALLRIIRRGHLDFATRAWELRENFTAYDAVCLALAESLDATVVTCDRPFASAPGHSARIEVIRPAADRGSRRSVTKTDAAPSVARLHGAGEHTGRKMAFNRP